MRLRGIEAVKARRKSKKHKPADQCLFHSAMEKRCTCTEENRPLTAQKLGGKVAAEIEWRMRCVAVNPFMFRREQDEVEKIRELFG